MLKATTRWGNSTDKVNTDRSYNLNRFSLSSSRIILILFLAFGLRVWGLQGQSLSMDELSEIGIAKTTIMQIILAEDGFPPLYHILLRGWLKVFRSDESARWLSVFFGCLSILAIWKMPPLLSKANARSWVALLLAISPFHIWYSQESRAYALYFFEATLALCFFFRAMETNRPIDWILYILACLAGIYTHYFFSILIAVNGIVLFIEKRTWNGLKYPLLAYGVLGLLSVPILWLLRYDLIYQTGYSIRTPFSIAALGYTFFSFLGGSFIGPSIRELHVLSTGNAIVQFLPWLLVIGCCVIFLGLQGLKGLSDKNKLRNLAIVTFIPVLLCGFLSEFLKVGFKTQYVLWTSIPLFILLSSGLSLSINRWSTRVSMIVLCLVFALSLYNCRYVERYMNEDTRKLAFYLSSQSDRDTPVFVMVNYMKNSVNYYLGDDWSVIPLPDVGKDGEGLEDSLKFIRDVVDGGSGFWIVYTRAFHGDPGGWFKKALLGNRMIRQQAEFAGIELYKGILQPVKFINEERPL